MVEVSATYLGLSRTQTAVMRALSTNPPDLRFDHDCFSTTAANITGNSVFPRRLPSRIVAATANKRQNGAEPESEASPHGDDTGTGDDSQPLNASHSLARSGHRAVGPCE